MAKAKQVCAICGTREATTRDHVPPKGIFLKPRPNDLITVPACFGCNHRGSKFDESFIAFLGLHLSESAPHAHRKPLFQRTVRIFRHNRRLRDKVLNTAKVVNVRSPAGLVLGQKHAVLWDSTAHTQVLDRTVRGLYFHHFDEILPASAKVKISWFRGLNDDLYKISQQMKQVEVGGDALIYRYGRAGESPHHSAWMFQFYNGHWASGFTEPSDGA